MRGFYDFLNRKYFIDIIYICNMVLVKKHGKRILILKQSNALKETFGIFKGKWKKSAQKIKNELRSELYNA